MEIVAPDVKTDIKSLDATSFAKKHGKTKTEIKNTFESVEEKVPEPGREAVGGRFTSRPPKSVIKPAPQVTSEEIEEIEEMDKSQTPPGRDGGEQFPPGPKVSKKTIKAVQKDPAKHLSDLFAKQYAKKKIKEEVEQIEEGRPSQRHPLEGHEYHKKTDAELVYIAKDAHKAAEAMKGHNTTAENKYRDQANDSATVRYFRQKNGMPDWYKKKYGHMKEEVMVEISSNTLKNYQQKVSNDAMKHKMDPTKRSPEKANRSISGFSKAQKRLEKGVAEEVMVEGGHDNAGGQYYDIKNSDGTIGMGYKPGKHHPSSPSRIEIKSEPKHPLHGKQVTNGKVTGRLIGTEMQGQAAKIKHSSGMIHHVDAKEIRKADMKEEAKDPKEYGYEGDMAMNQLQTIMRHAEYLMDMMKPDTDLPEWVQSKITLAADYIQTSCDYMTSEMKEEVEPPFTPNKPKTKVISGKSGKGYSTARHLARMAMQKQVDKLKKPVKESLEESRKAEIVKDIVKKKKAETEDTFQKDPELSSSLTKTQ